MEKPVIDVAIVAWPVSPARLEYFRRLVDSMQRLLTASRHEMRFVVSIGSEKDPNRKWCGPELVEYIEELGMKYQWRTRPVEVLGYSMNETVALCSNPYILLVQDDAVAESAVDISDGVDLMEDRPDIDAIRYGWSMHPRLTISTKPFQPGWEQIVLGGRWPFSDNVHLRRASFVEKFGAYTETTSHGQSERDMIGKVRANNALILTAGSVPSFRNGGVEPACFRDGNRAKLLKRLREEGK